MKNYLLAILIGLISWVIINSLFFTNIVDVVIKEENTLYLHLYYLVSYLVIGFIIGWFGKTNGSLLGLIFGIVIIIISCVDFWGTNMSKTASGKIVDLDSIKRIILSLPTLIIIACSLTGGFLGSRIRAYQDKLDKRD